MKIRKRIKTLKITKNKNNCKRDAVILWHPAFVLIQNSILVRKKYKIDEKMTEIPFHYSLREL